MKSKLLNDLSKYSMLTYCEEKRNEKGELLFFVNYNYDKIEIDPITNFIILSNKDDPGSAVCMINPSLDYNITPLKYSRDKLTLFTGTKNKIFVCKKK